MKARELIRRLSRPTGDAARDIANLRGDLVTILQNLDSFEPLAAGAGDVLVGTMQLNTAAVKGFLYVPRAQGTPTGAPTNYSAGSPVVFDEKADGLLAYDFARAAWVRVPGSIVAAVGGLTAAQAGLISHTAVSAGMYRVSARVLVTTSTTHNFNVKVDYTDEAGTARTLFLTFYQLSGTAGVSIANAAGAVPYHGASHSIFVKAGTTITVYTAGTFTTVTYDVVAALERLS